jgi:hypothetical protein
VKPIEAPAHEAKETKGLEKKEMKTGKELGAKKGFPRKGFGGGR